MQAPHAGCGPVAEAISGATPRLSASLIALTRLSRGRAGSGKAASTAVRR